MVAVLIRTAIGGENTEKHDNIEWLNCDAEYPGFENLTDEQIVEQAIGVQDVEETEEDELPTQPQN